MTNFNPNKRFSFEDLEVYKAARLLVKEIYLLQNKFPKEEKYALGDQIRRSSTSITSNIAEPTPNRTQSSSLELLRCEGGRPIGQGSGRASTKEKIHFIEIAFGSMTESFSQLQNAQDLGYIEEREIDALRPQYNKVAALLSGLKRSFERKRSTGTVPMAFD